MRRYLLDTGAASDYIHNRGNTFAKARAAQAAGGRIGVGMPTVGELYAGIELSATKSKNLPKLRRGPVDFFLWPLDPPAAEEYGRIYALLKRRGRMIQQIDMQLAAIALCPGNCTVVTKDSDFAAIPGLKIEDWS